MTRIDWVDIAVPMITKLLVNSVWREMAVRKLLCRQWTGWTKCRPVNIKKFVSFFWPPSVGCLGEIANQNRNRRGDEQVVLMAWRTCDQLVRWRICSDRWWRSREGVLWSVYAAHLGLWNWQWIRISRRRWWAINYLFEIGSKFIVPWVSVNFCYMLITDNIC